MSTNKTNSPKPDKRVLIGLMMWGVVLVWALGFSESLPLLRNDPQLLANSGKLIVLVLASMTVAATLLTTKPEDDPVKQFSFLLIAITGIVAAVFTIKPVSWGLLLFVIAGLVPAVFAFVSVAWKMFGNSKGAFSLLVAGVVLVWGAVFMMNSELGADIVECIGAGRFYAAVISAAAAGYVAAAVGMIWERSNRRRNAG